MAKLMSKSELIQKIADRHSNGLSRKDIKAVVESLASVGYKELKKTEAFLSPGSRNLLSLRNLPQKRAKASILLQRSRQYSKPSQLGRSSGLAQ